ncbi:MAG: XRE family transcriptional regulator [Burkholderiales bacterium]|nr:XRE family transcriptional regulator [Burkholderiales bacterium]
MVTKTKSAYEHLGFPDADEMLVKARLVFAISEQIKRRHLVQTEAAALLGFSQPRLSNLLRGEFRGVSERKLMNCLTKLGHDIEIVVRPAPRSRREGRISIELAR